MDKRKREETKKKLEGDDIDDLEEALEDKMEIEDEEKSASSEEEGEDLMKDLEK
jgi:hypothetical protein